MRFVDFRLIVVIRVDFDVICFVLGIASSTRWTLYSFGFVLRRRYYWSCFIGGLFRVIG